MKLRKTLFTILTIIIILASILIFMPNGVGSTGLTLKSPNTECVGINLQTQKVHKILPNGNISFPGFEYTVDSDTFAYYEEGYCLGRQAVDLESKNTQEEFDWKIPEMTEEYNWKTRKITKDSEEALDYRIFWDTRNSNNTEKKLEYGEIPLGGTIYEITLTDEDEGYEKLNDRYQGYLITQLVNSGWSKTIDSGDHYISGMAADGVSGSNYGLIKMNDNKVRTVAYAYDLNVLGWEGPGSDTSCPCTLNLSIFVSDIGDLSTEIPNFE